MFLFTTYIFSLVKCLLKSFAHFEIGKRLNTTLNTQVINHDQVVFMQECKVSLTFENQCNSPYEQTKNQKLHGHFYRCRKSS